MCVCAYACNCLIRIKVIAVFPDDLFLRRNSEHFPSARRMLLLFAQRILFQSARASEIPFVNGAVLIKP